MYDDYPTIYESNLNLDYVYLVIIGIISLIAAIITFISLAKIFKKANRSGISAWIPIYNIWILLEITNQPKWYFIMMFVPILNLFVYINVMFSLAKAFKKSKFFAVGMVLLPFIFLPIIAFSDNEYFGINLIAMEGKNISNIPVIETKKDEPEIQEHNEKDQNLKNINISIGGGVYQKNYTNDLLQVDEKQAILKETEEQLKEVKFENSEINSIDTNINTNNNFVNTNSIEKNIINDDKIKNNNLVQLEIPNIIIDTNTNTNNDNIQIKPIADNNISTTPVNNNNNNNNNNSTEFITCPKCGATVKANSSKCFLCGQNLN